jgi:hypothetical protein
MFLSSDGTEEPRNHLPSVNETIIWVDENSTKYPLLSDLTTNTGDMNFSEGTNDTSSESESFSYQEYKTILRFTPAGIILNGYEYFRPDEYCIQR